MTWTGIPDDYQMYVGFVYLIIETDTRKGYIGIKRFWKTEKKQPNYRDERKMNTPWWLAGRFFQ